MKIPNNGSCSLQITPSVGKRIWMPWPTTNSYTDDPLLAVISVIRKPVYYGRFSWFQRYQISYSSDLYKHELLCKAGLVVCLLKRFYCTIIKIYQLRHLLVGLFPATPPPPPTLQSRRKRPRTFLGWGYSQKWRLSVVYVSWVAKWKGKHPRSLHSICHPLMITRSCKLLFLTYSTNS